jgi:hypothetical protein
MSPRKKHHKIETQVRTTKQHVPNAEQQVSNGKQQVHNNKQDLSAKDKEVEINKEQASALDLTTQVTAAASAIVTAAKEKASAIVTAAEAQASAIVTAAEEQASSIDLTTQVTAAEEQASTIVMAAEEQPSAINLTTQVTAAEEQASAIDITTQVMAAKEQASAIDITTQVRITPYVSPLQNDTKLSAFERFIMAVQHGCKGELHAWLSKTFYHKQVHQGPYSSEDHRILQDMREFCKEKISTTVPTNRYAVNIDGSYHYREQGGTSYINDAEISHIMSDLGMMCSDARFKDKTILVASFYRAQVTELKASLPQVAWCYSPRRKRASLKAHL